MIDKEVTGRPTGGEKKAKNREELEVEKEEEGEQNKRGGKMRMGRRYR